jgi:hypothetical protein
MLGTVSFTVSLIFRATLLNKTVRLLTFLCTRFSQRRNVLLIVFGPNERSNLSRSFGTDKHTNKMYCYEPILITFKEESLKMKGTPKKDEKK